MEELKRAMQANRRLRLIGAAPVQYRRAPPAHSHFPRSIQIGTHFLRLVPQQPVGVPALDVLELLRIRIAFSTRAAQRCHGTAAYCGRPE